MNEQDYIYSVAANDDGSCYVRCYPPGHFPAKYGESKQDKHKRLYEQTFIFTYGKDNWMKVLNNETF